jgi:alpha-glucosidase (family GH31 glycosyl hydrolase)
MADFGEALPYDARLAEGEAKPFHNAYPEEWARLNRELIEEVGRGEDVVFFMRSGFTRSQALDGAGGLHTGVPHARGQHPGPQRAGVLG